MTEPRRNEQYEQLRRHPNSNAKSKSKHRLHTLRKEVFLTDTQTSDYTKSSSQMRIYKIQQLQLTVRDLERENDQLKQSIVNMKANQFFQLNQEKLKDLIRENERYRHENAELRRQLEQSLIQRDFLKRFNKNLKNQCEALTKKILTIKSNAPGPANQSRRIEKSMNNSSSEDMRISYKRSLSAEVALVRKKNRQDKIKPERRQRQSSFGHGGGIGATIGETQAQQSYKNGEPSLNFDYFHGSFNKQKKSKYNIN